MQEIYKDPRFIYEFETSYISFGNSQYFIGYIIQFAKKPYESLTVMPKAERAKYLEEMCLVGDVMMDVLDAWRINYMTLGNSHEVVHTHLFPRYLWEEESLRKGPVYYYDKSIWTMPDKQFDEVEFSSLKEKFVKSFKQ